MALNDSVIFGISSDNRYVEVYTLLADLLKIIRPKDHVILIIRCNESVLARLQRLTKRMGKEKKVTFILTDLKSSAAKRNIVVDWAINHQEYKYLFFLDDDLLLPENLLDCLAKFSSDKFEIAVVAPTVREVLLHDQSDAPLGFFRFQFLQNFYPLKQRIARSGWHGVRGAPPNVLHGIWWNNVAALVIRVDKINGCRFPLLDGYSYLEDVFFTKELSQKGLIMARSEVEIGHLGYDKFSYEFGLMEVINRRKLSKTITRLGIFFYCMMFLRLSVNCIGIFKNKLLILRVLGNLKGIISLCKRS